LIAARKGALEQLEELLLTFGDQVNVKDPVDGSTPLYNACDKGNDAIVVRLLQANADVNIPTIYGVTPLMRASHKGHVHIVDELVAKPETEINAASESGYSALIYE